MEEYKQKLVDLLVKYYNSETRTVSELFDKSLRQEILDKHSEKYLYLDDSKNDFGYPIIIQFSDDSNGKKRFPNSETICFDKIILNVGAISASVSCLSPDLDPLYEIVNNIADSLYNIGSDKKKKAKQNRINEDVDILNKQLETI